MKSPLAATSRFHGALACLVLVIASTTTLPARAEPPTSAGSSQEIYRKAHTAMQRQEWAEARRLLLELWTRARTHDVAASLGEVEFRLENYSQGARYLAFAVAYVPPQEPTKTVEWYQALLSDLKKRVATVQVIVPPEATLYVDGAAVESFVEPGPHGRQLFLDPGRHTVEGRSGAARGARDVDVEAGADYYFALKLEDTTTPSQNGAPSNAPAPPPERPDSPREGAARQNLLPLYVGVGLTAAGAATWVGFGFAVRSARSDVNAYASRIGRTGCSDGTADPALCTAARDALARERSSALIGNIGLGVALTAGLATAAYVLFWPEPSEPSASVRLRPSLALDTNGGGLGLSGEF